MYTEKSENKEITKAELKERFLGMKISKQQFNWKIKSYTKLGSYKHYDCIITSAGTDFYCEIKFREDTNCWDWNDSFIEEYKYDELKALGTNILVLCVYKDHYYRVFDANQYQRKARIKTNKVTKVRPGEEKKQKEKDFVYFTHSNSKGGRVEDHRSFYCDYDLMNKFIDDNFEELVKKYS